MDWKGQIEMTGDLLDRIVALLLAIADLAERAAGAPEARRRLALDFIRRAETVAGGFVSASSRAFPNTERAPTTTASGDGRGDTPEDAIALALSLRMLALLLRCITGQMRRLAGLAPGGGAGETIGQRLPRDRHRQFVPCFANARFPREEILDTS
ncbi:MAG: hypothetical protein Q8Q62_00965 [Mesorhizobium sp.]|nr:hypothetical protein [Mesorhizobium sp.]